VQIFRRVFAAAEIPLLMNHAPTFINAPGNYTLIAGQNLSVTNTATDADLPAQTLTWALLSPLEGASLNQTNGVFTWRPKIVQSPGSYAFAVKVSDNGSPGMNATQAFAVTVARPQSPQLTGPTVSNGIFSLAVAGDAGPDYIVQATTNLAFPASWLPVFTNTPAALPFQWSDPSAYASPQKFYRVVVGP
jgi:hypothetical protein